MNISIGEVEDVRCRQQVEINDQKIADLQSQATIITLRKEVLRLKQELDPLINEVKRLRSDNTTLKAQHQGSFQRMATITKANMNLRSRIDQAEAENQSLADEVQRLRCLLEKIQKP